MVLTKAFSDRLEEAIARYHTLLVNDEARAAASRRAQTDVVADFKLAHD